MPVQPPSAAAIRNFGGLHALDLSDEEISEYRDLMAGVLPSYSRLDELSEPKPPVSVPRTPGYPPPATENELNAWFWRCAIKGSDNGPLVGKRIVVKDNTCVAGVPMMNGAGVLAGFVPDIDATVVTRVLEAGGEITGKAVCEYLCFSGGSHTSDTGPVRNPHDLTRSSGGSSSGSAALVVTGECDMAIGGDQGGSIRIPSSWCGAFGLKPTYGLIPYTGAMAIERTLDHLGPIAATVADVAGLLQVLAGPDGYDARQVDITVDDYLTDLDSGIGGFRVGIVEEGFGWPGSEADVDDCVRAVVESVRELGATVETISIPWHRDGIHVWNAIAVEGALGMMIHGNGGGTNAKGFYDTTLLDAFRRGRHRNPENLSVTVKLAALLGEHMQRNYGGRYYAKAQNLAILLTDAYNNALNDYDVLVMPTTPMKATTIPGEGASKAEVTSRALEMVVNACPFDISGHPAINIPCGVSDGLPVGLMAIGRRLGEAAILRFARALETSVTPLSAGVRPGDQLGPTG
jgi:amidase